VRKQLDKMLPKGNNIINGGWVYSYLYMQLDTLKNWHGPLPSEMGLCSPEVDLALMTQFNITSKKLESANNGIIHLGSRKKHIIPSGGKQRGKR
jgi:hypothetical protein